MDWSNERWVRLYTRDTADDLVLSWQAQGLWPLLLRKADRAGVIATNHGARGIAALVRWPPDVVSAALPELLEDGRIRECSDPRGYVIPNWTAAQETPSSDAQRKRDERERRSARANDSVTKRDGEVTKRDEMSRPSHDKSRLVTPRRDETRVDETRREETEERPVRKRTSKAQLPDGWVPDRSEANITAEAEATTRGVNLRSELSQLRDWAKANHEPKADWNATWRNWIRRAKGTASQTTLRVVGRAEPQPASAYEADIGKAF